ARGSAQSEATRATTLGTGNPSWGRSRWTRVSVTAASTSQSADTENRLDAEHSPAEGQPKGQEGQEGLDDDPGAGQPGQRRDDPDKELGVAPTPEPSDNQAHDKEEVAKDRSVGKPLSAREHR